MINIAYQGAAFGGARTAVSRKAVAGQAAVARPSAGWRRVVDVPAAAAAMPAVRLALAGHAADTRKHAESFASVNRGTT